MVDSQLQLRVSAGKVGRPAPLVRHAVGNGGLIMVHYRVLTERMDGMNSVYSLRRSGESLHMIVVGATRTRASLFALNLVGRAVIEACEFNLWAVRAAHLLALHLFRQHQALKLTALIFHIVDLLLVELALLLPELGLLAAHELFLLLQLELLGKQINLLLLYLEHLELSIVSYGQALVILVVA